MRWSRVAAWLAFSLPFRNFTHSPNQVLQSGSEILCFEDLLHPFVSKLFLHLKEATLHLQRKDDVERASSWWLLKHRPLNLRPVGSDRVKPCGSN